MRGYQVIEADCAEEALELLKDDDLDFDVFVTDVIMPGLDGPTWVREALKKRPDVKVIFVSGYAEDSLADQQGAHSELGLSAQTVFAEPAGRDGSGTDCLRGYSAARSGSSGRSSVWSDRAASP